MGNKKKKSYKGLIYLFVVILIVSALFLVFNSGSEDKSIKYSEAQDILFEGIVQEIYVNNGTGYILLFKNKQTTAKDATYKTKLTDEQRKNFPNQFDYFFTYNNTTEDLKFIQDFKDAVNYVNVSGSTEHLLNKLHGYHVFFIMNKSEAEKLDKAEISFSMRD